MHLAYLSLLVAAPPVLVKPLPPPTPQPPAKVEMALATDEQILKAAYLGSDGPALLDFFRSRVSPAPDKAALDALISLLADKDAASADRRCRAIHLPRSECGAGAAADRQ